YDADSTWASGGQVDDPERSYHGDAWKCSDRQDVEFFRSHNADHHGIIRVRGVPRVA
ncbi:hypothetical protein LSAT2_018273, partial [Lamellibrachia satsuma]